MSRLHIITESEAELTAEGLRNDFERRIVTGTSNLCPVDMTLAFLRLCHTQTCGKCVPCRIGLGHLVNILEEILEGNATLDAITLLEKTANVITNTADCAIGYGAADMVIKGLSGFRDDYEEHILNGKCTMSHKYPVPCVALCPAGVDVPGYIALIAEGRNKDAVKLIRKDNPFPSVCGTICEHPCETRCRRSIIDDAINIRGLKRFAVEQAGDVPVPKKAEPTGKTVAILGGGPCGLSAAYYLTLMGHDVTVFEKQDKLGGMLRYGIPDYRLPQQLLDQDINAILSLGIKINSEVNVGKDIPVSDLREQFDALYVSIGAHTDKKLGIEGEDADGVISAVKILRDLGKGYYPDLTGKSVVVVGGGNVAMDACRSTIRLGAKDVSVAYRRRIKDMTALSDEIEGAIAEGCEILSLKKPVRIETDSHGRVSALWVKPQIIGKIDKSGRPAPYDSKDQEDIRLECQIVIIAIGQNIDLDHFKEFGLPINRGTITALSDSGFSNMPGIFAGGDCVSGPATVIKAINAGKVAAANIDQFLGFHHIIESDVSVPSPIFSDKPACARVNMTERNALQRKDDFEMVEIGLSCEEADQESHRCLRCDYYGYGSFKGGRTSQW